MKKLLITAFTFLTVLATSAQTKSADTVVVALAKTSKVVFTMKDRADIPLLKQYDYQALFADIITKLEKSDTIPVPKDTTKNETTTNEPVTWDDDDDDAPSWSEGRRSYSKYRHRRARHSFNFDFGTNNYIEDGKFPDADDKQYAVRPWGSWYVGINSVQRAHLSKKMYLEWGVGVSWYNFKFQNDATQLVQDLGDVDGVYFIEDTRDVSFIKSKLTVSYINVSLIPMFDVSGNSRKVRVWDSHSSAFRFGVGPYAGYRIGSHTKQVYKEDGDREKDKDRDNFYLNNLRYGVRMQLGIRSADFFFNYDLNELFATNKGPKLNAFSFGVIF
jgi:hypothetical protein